MRTLLIGLTAAGVLAMSAAANAQSTTGTIGGAATGAVIGSVAGPPGAIVGGVIGAGIGNEVGPRDRRYRNSYARGTRECWRDSRGKRHCQWR